MMAIVLPPPSFYPRKETKVYVCQYNDACIVMVWSFSIQTELNDIQS